MRLICETKLTPMQAGRLNAQLDKAYMFSFGVMTLREFILSQETIVKSECDGMIDWSRTKFNRMNGNQQIEYEKKLKSKRHYFINDIKVPKIVYDAVIN